MSNNTITPETLDNLRALIKRQRVPHPDAPINTGFFELGNDLVVGEPAFVATPSGREVVDLADRVAIIAGKALWFDDSADHEQALWEVLELVHPVLAELLESESDAAQALLYPEDGDSDSETSDGPALTFPPVPG